MIWKFAHVKAVYLARLCEFFRFFRATSLVLWLFDHLANLKTDPKPGIHWSLIQWNRKSMIWNCAHIKPIYMARLCEIFRFFSPTSLVLWFFQYPYPVRSPRLPERHLVLQPNWARFACKIEPVNTGDTSIPNSVTRIRYDLKVCTRKGRLGGYTVWFFQIFSSHIFSVMMFWLRNELENWPKT